MNEALEEVACDLCGSTGSFKVLFQLGDWRYNKPSPEYSVSRCRQCGLVQLNPRPTTSAMANHYPQDYDSSRKADDPKVLVRYRAQEELLGGTPGRILDVGAAAGDFVDYLAARGHDVTGIDPFARSAISSRVLPIDLFARSLDEERFDTVTAWHVLEHVFSPSETLSRMASLLRPDGQVVLSVPNFNSYRGYWLRGEDVPRHIFFYDIRSLTRLAASAGMKVVKEVYDPRLANGSLGRGAFVQYAYRTFSRTSHFAFLRMCHGMEPYPTNQSLVAGLYAKCLGRLERFLLTEEKLVKNKRLGVVAVVLAKR